MEWQPIETAPKDGAHIIAIRDEFGHRTATIIFWDDGFGEWCGRTAREELIVANFPPTHWMPLPPAPEAAS